MNGTGLLTSRPAVRPEILLGPALLRGMDAVHLIKDPDSGRSFEIGSKEHFLITRLDGTRSLSELGTEYENRFGRRLGESSWRQLLGLLYTRQLLAGLPPGGGPAGPARVDELQPSSPRSSMLKGSLALIKGTSQALDRWHSRARFLVSAWFVVPLLLVSAAMTVTVGSRLPDYLRATESMYRQPVSAIAVLIVLWVGAAVHELAHGVVARQLGGTVTEFGVKWYLLLLFPYCKVENYLYLARRSRQVAIAGAGVPANMLFLLPFFVAQQLLQPGTPTSDALAGLMLMGVVLALVNLIPIPPLDGYKMLGHSIGIPNLAEQSILYTVQAIRGHRSDFSAYPVKARRAYAGYSVAAGLAAVGVLAAAGELCHRFFAGSIGWVSYLLPLVVLALAGAVVVLRLKLRPRSLPTPANSATPASPARPIRGRHRLKGFTPMIISTSGPKCAPAIVLHQVQKRYGHLVAVDGISLTVNRGEFFGLLGPNGAGKTTLVEIATGLRAADGGTVTMLGEAPWPRNRGLITRIGIQTQASAFFVRLTAREHLQTVGALYGVGRRQVADALKTVGLVEKADTRVDDLSGGQQQRLAIAAALLHDPELIFLDEPTAALDPQARRALWVLLRELKSQGRTVVYTTHHLDEAEALCDRVAIIDEGRLVAIGSPAELAGSADDSVWLSVPAERLTVEQGRLIDGVEEAEADGVSTCLRTRSAGSVLAALSSTVGLRGVRTRTVGLEDVYLKLTGSEQRQS